MWFVPWSVYIWSNSSLGTWSWWALSIQICLTTFWVGTKSENVVLPGQANVLMLPESSFYILPFFSILYDSHILGTFPGTWEHNWEENRHRILFLGTSCLVKRTSINQILKHVIVSQAGCNERRRAMVYSMDSWSIHAYWMQVYVGGAVSKERCMAW